MASRTVIEEGKDGEREKRRYKENKVYTRKSFKGSKNKFLDYNRAGDTTTTTAANNEDRSNEKNDKNDNNSAEAPAQPLPLEFGVSTNQQPAPYVDTAVSVNLTEAPARPLSLKFGDSTNQQPAPCVDTAVSGNSTEAPAHPLPLEFAGSTNQQPTPCVDTAVSGNLTEVPAQPLPLEFGDSTNQQPAPCVDTAVSGNSTEAPTQPLPLEFGDSTNQQPAPCIDTAVSGNSTEAPTQPLPSGFGDSTNQQSAPWVDSAVSGNSAEAPAQPQPLEFGDSINQQPAPRVDIAVSGNSAEAPALPLPLEFGDSTNHQPAPCIDTVVSDNSAEALARPLPLEFGDSTNQQPAPCVEKTVSGNSTEAPAQPLHLEFGELTNQQPAPRGDTAVSGNLTEAPAQTLTLENGDSTNHQPAPREDTAVSDDSSSLKRQKVVAEDGAVEHGSQNRGKIGFASRPKQEIQELRRKLESELNVVRNLVKRIEAKEEQISGFSNSRVPFNGGVGFPFNGVQSEVASVGIYEEPIVKQSRPLNQLNITVMGNSQGANESLEKKRTPKANQFYRNSEFLLAKDKFPAGESNKKSKSTGKKLGDGGFPHSFGTGNKFFKRCSSLLERMMKHKHGWVFNTPVDVKGLGLHDYYTIIMHPMDLGTVKSRLNQNWYKSPIEFAEDVRLTFSNAMTYNPKGQDVHVMAEQLSQIFEDKWAAVEADWFRDMRFGIEYEVAPPMPTPRMAHPVRPPPLDMRSILDRQESMVRPVDLRQKLIATTPSSRTPTLKKPKAKDLYKRDMTYDEKQKLSTNLLSLPSEKLDNIVHIIKKSNSALLQHDDEIEVDIDSVDNDTLWELDRFYTNYKKNLSKHKRKAELALQARAEAEQNLTKRTPAPVLLEVPKEAATKEQNVLTSPVEMEKQGNNASRSSSSSSSSSDSGSSSSDSDSGSSSSSGSDAGHSPRS